MKRHSENKSYSENEAHLVCISCFVNRDSVSEWVCNVENEAVLQMGKLSSSKIFADGNACRS